jgi:hypothetical protein
MTSRTNNSRGERDIIVWVVTHTRVHVVIRLKGAANSNHRARQDGGDVHAVALNVGVKRDTLVKFVNELLFLGRE